MGQHPIACAFLSSFQNDKSHDVNFQSLNTYFCCFSFFNTMNKNFVINCVLMYYIYFVCFFIYFCFFCLFFTLAFFVNNEERQNAKDLKSIDSTDSIIIRLRVFMQIRIFGITQSELKQKFVPLNVTVSNVAMYFRRFVYFLHIRRLLDF